MAKTKITTVANDTNIYTRRITVERGPKGTGMTVTFTSTRMDRPETRSIQHPDVEAQYERILRSRTLTEADKFDILRALNFAC